MSFARVWCVEANGGRMGYFMEPIPASTLRKIGTAVRAARLGAGLSQEKLAERADLSPHYVSNLERGIQEPRIGVLIAVARASKVKLHALLKAAGL